MLIESTLKNTAGIYEEVVSLAPRRFTPFPGVRPKATRTLDAAAVEDLRRSADTYVANWRRYTSGLRRIDHEAQSEAKVRG